MMYAVFMIGAMALLGGIVRLAQVLGCLCRCCTGHW